jgi:hypothetical protein
MLNTGVIIYAHETYLMKEIIKILNIFSLFKRLNSFRVLQLRYFRIL